MHSITRAFLNVVFPTLCPGCSRFDENFDGVLCGECRSKLIPASGLELSRRYNQLFLQPGAVSALFSLYVFTETSPVRGIIHSFKYEKRYRLARFIGTQLSNALPSAICSSPSQVIIPVPLHRLRMSERGYNQSELLARAISRDRRIPLDSDLLKRLRYTAVQAKMKHHQRKRNIAGAFAADPKKITGRTVLLVDDVITTGSTINECARVLKASGAAEVRAISFAVV